MSSCSLKGIRCAFKNPLQRPPLRHTRLYLHIFSLLNISFAVNIPWANSIIAPLSFVMRSYCSQTLSIGRGLSHPAYLLLLLSCPYGKSQIMQSTLPSGIRFIPSRQSSLYILFRSILFQSSHCSRHSQSSPIQTKRSIQLHFRTSQSRRSSRSSPSSRTPIPCSAASSQTVSCAPALQDTSASTAWPPCDPLLHNQEPFRQSVEPWNTTDS